MGNEAAMGRTLTDKTTDKTGEDRPGRTRMPLWKAVVVILLAATLIGLARQFEGQDLLKDALGWIRGLGSAGPLIFVGTYVLATVLFLPGSILSLGAGALFGVVNGSIIVSVSSTLGATCAFLVGRYLARGWVEAKIEGNPKFEAIDASVAREGWKIVGLTRLSPAFPFNLLNYAFGITKVSLRDYFFASWAGMLPGTILYVYIGSLAGDLATLGQSGGPTTPLQWIFRIVGLAATIIVTVWVTRMARKALAVKVP